MCVCVTVSVCAYMYVCMIPYEKTVPINICTCTNTHNTHTHTHTQTKGGAIVWQMALFFPQRVSSIVSLCTPYRLRASRYLSVQQIAQILPAFHYQVYFNKNGGKDAARCVYVCICVYVCVCVYVCLYVCVF